MKVVVVLGRGKRAAAFFCTSARKREKGCGAWATALWREESFTVEGKSCAKPLN